MSRARTMQEHRLDKMIQAVHNMEISVGTFVGEDQRSMYFPYQTPNLVKVKQLDGWSESECPPSGSFALAAKAGYRKVAGADLERCIKSAKEEIKILQTEIKDLEKSLENLETDPKIQIATIPLGIFEYQYPTSNKLRLPIVMSRFKRDDEFHYDIHLEAQSKDLCLVKCSYLKTVASVEKLVECLRIHIQGFARSTDFILFLAKHHNPSAMEADLSNLLKTVGKELKKVKIDPAIAEFVFHWLKE